MLQRPRATAPSRYPALSPWRHFSQLTSRFPGATVSERQTQQSSSSPGRAAVKEQNVRGLLPTSVPTHSSLCCHRLQSRGSHLG